MPDELLGSSLFQTAPTLVPLTIKSKEKISSSGSLGVPLSSHRMLLALAVIEQGSGTEQGAGALMVRLALQFGSSLSATLKLRSPLAIRKGPRLMT